MLSFYKGRTFSAGWATNGLNKDESRQLKRTFPPVQNNNNKKKTTKPRTTYCVTVVNTAVGILLFFFLNITTEYTNVSAVGLCVIIIEATKLDIDKTGGYLISETWMALLFSLLCISIRIIIEHWSLYFDYYLIWAWWEAYKLEDLTIFL